MQQPIDTIVFHENTSTPSEGLVYTVNSGVTTINVEFETTGTFTAIFEAKCNDKTTTFKKVMVANLGTLDLVSETSDATAIYSIDTTGIMFVRINITAVSGTVSVYGRAVC